VDGLHSTQQCERNSVWTVTFSHSGLNVHNTNDLIGYIPCFSVLSRCWLVTNWGGHFYIVKNSASDTYKRFPKKIFWVPG